MINTIKESKLLKFEKIIRSQIFLSKSFPDQKFKKAKSFSFLEFEAFATKLFFDAFTKLSENSTFYSLEPDPRKYYYYYFKKFNVFEFKKTHSYEDYLNVLHRQPLQDSADAIIDILEEFVILSNNLDLIVYGDRKINALIVGSRSDSILNEFKKLYGIQYTFNNEEALKDLIPESAGNVDLILQNYRTNK